MEAELGIQLKGRSGSTYRLDRYLGGGQTAHVYQATVLEDTNPQRVGVSVAVKMMQAGLDTDTRRRFWQEETVLSRLATGLKDRPRAGQPLVPEVWDSGDSFGGGFLVMTVAQGQPLDELLRSGTEWSEDDALHLFEQLAAVFCSLHTVLHRTYLDFQPRNIFWHADNRSICVIDWNLLSSPYEPEDGSQSSESSPEARQAYRKDMLVIARLFYRLLLGDEPTGPTRLKLARPERWQKLTQTTRNLLWDLMQPESPHLESVKALCLRIDGEIVRRNGSGDSLLKEAAEIIDKLRHAEDEEHKPGTVMELREKAAGLLELAEQKGLNRAWTRILENLHEELDANQETVTYVGRGQASLRAGDRSVATEYFLEGIRMAVKVDEQVQSWRWWLLTSLSLPKDDQDQIFALLSQVQGIVPSQSSAEELIEVLRKTSSTSPIRPLLQEVLAQFHAVRLMGLVIREIDDEKQLVDWIELGERIQAEIDDLPGEIENQRYSDSAWMALGAGDAKAGRQRIAHKLDEARKRRYHLQTLNKEIERIDSPLTALASLQDHPNYAAEGRLASALLGKSSQWLDVKEYLAPYLDLLRILEMQGQPPLRQKQIVDFRRKLHRLLVAQHWVEQLEESAGRIAQERTVDFLAIEKSEEIGQILSESIDNNGILVDGRLDTNEFSNDSPQIVLLKDRTIYSVALEQTTALLKIAHQEVKEAPNFVDGLLSRLIDVSVQLRVVVPHLDEWLRDINPTAQKLLVTSQKATEEAAQLRADLDQAEEDYRLTRTRIQKQFRLEVERLRTENKNEVENLSVDKKNIEVKLELAKKQLKQLSTEYIGKKAIEEEKLADSLQDVRSRNKAGTERLESKLKELQNKRENVEEEYEKEKTLQQNRAADYKKQANEKADELNRIKADIKEFEKQRGDFENDTKRAGQEAQSARTELNKAQNEQQEKLKEYNGILDDKRQALEQYKEELTKRELELNELQKEISDLHQQMDSELAALKQLQKERGVEKPHGTRRGDDNSHQQSNSPSEYSMLGNNELSEIVRISDVNYRQFNEAASPGRMDLTKAFTLAAQSYSLWEQATMVQRDKSEEKLVADIKRKWEECRRTYFERMNQWSGMVNR